MSTATTFKTWKLVVNLKKNFAARGDRIWCAAAHFDSVGVNNHFITPQFALLHGSTFHAKVRNSFRNQTPSNAFTQARWPAGNWPFTNHLPVRFMVRRRECCNPSRIHSVSGSSYTPCSPLERLQRHVFCPTTDHQFWTSDRRLSCRASLWLKTRYRICDCGTLRPVSRYTPRFFSLNGLFGGLSEHAQCATFFHFRLSLLCFDLDQNMTLFSCEKKHCFAFVLNSHPHFKNGIVYLWITPKS